MTTFSTLYGQRLWTWTSSEDFFGAVSIKHQVSTIIINYYMYNFFQTKIFFVFYIFFYASEVSLSEVVTIVSLELKLEIGLELQLELELELELSVFSVICLTLSITILFALLPVLFDKKFNK